MRAQKTDVRIEVDALANKIAEVASHIDAATHTLLTYIRDFDERSGWSHQGALSCAHWLNWRIGLQLGAAREKVRVARALGGLPRIDDALRRGAISYSKVRALTRIAGPHNEAELLDWAEASTASQLENICRKYRKVRALEGTRPEDEAMLRYVRSRAAGDGFTRIEIQLPAEEAAVVERALARKVEELRAAASAPEEADDVPAETSRPMATELADAVVAIAEDALDSSAENTGRHRFPAEILLHVTAEDDGAPSACLEDGTRLPDTTAGRMLCDASVTEVTESAAGDVLSVGRRKRTIPSAIKRALLARDCGCRFPGCTNRLADGHHIVPWSEGGETSLANLCLLCRRHHRFVHEHGFTIEAEASGRLRFLAPAGWEIPTVGAAPSVRTPGARIGLVWLHDLHEAAGLGINANTAKSRWDGGPTDYDMAIDGLLMLDEAAPPSGAIP